MFRISESVRLRKFPDGGVLLDVERGGMFSLNPVGTRIVELLQHDETLASLVARISHDFSVPRETVEQDVHEFLSCLRREQLLKEQQAEGDGGA